MMVSATGGRFVLSSRILEGGTLSDSMVLFFMKPGTYQISFTISEGSQQETTFLDVNVDPRDITLERESYGEVATYSVEGHLRLDRLYNSVDSSDIRDYSILDADFWTPDSDPMVTEINENSMKYVNGLGGSFQCLERRTDQRLKLSGYLEPETGPRSTLTGETILDQSSYTDIYTKKATALVSDITYDLSFQTSIGTKDYISNQKVWTYPSLEDSAGDLRIEDISPERKITIEDSGTTDWGSYELDWTALEYDRIMDVPCLRLSLSLDTASMNRLSLSEMVLDIWVGDEIPQIMKMILNVSSSRDVQTPYVLDYEQEMISHRKGSDPVIFEDIEYEHDLAVRVDQVHQDLESEFHNDWDMVPRAGTMFTSIPSDFSAEDAVSSFKNNPNYRNFERTLSDPLAIYTNFSVKLGQDQWKFSITDQGENRAWNQTVLREASPPGLAAKVDPVNIGRTEIGEILTYSGAEVSLKRLIGSVNQEAARGFFGVTQVEDTRSVDTGRYFIGTMVDMDYPALGLVNPTLSERIDYGMFIISKDGKMEIGLDMTSGQIAFVRFIN